MKKTLLIMTLVAVGLVVWSQAPNMFNYQGIARNTSGQPLASANITIRISILDGSNSGTTLYTETRSVITNQLGIFTIAIGGSGAQSTTGNFASINWASNSKYIKVEADATGGNNFALLGNTQLLSVPYALYAGGAPTKEFIAGPGISISGDTLNTLNTDPIWNSRQLQGKDISNIPPLNGQMLIWDSVGNNWKPGVVSNSFSGWNLTGNLGTNPSNNFIGTTDALPLVIKVKNIKSGLIDSASANTALGFKSLLNNISGSSNVAIGVNSLQNNTTRSGLVAVGDSALFFNGIGAVNLWEASWNTAVGSNSLFSNTIGYGNTALGYYALDSNTTGAQNTALGLGALQYNTIGNNNTAVGPYAGYRLSTGNNNTAIGEQALSSATWANNNTSIGYSALNLNISGNSNVAVGNSALNNNTSQSDLVAIGDSAMFNNGTGARNTAIGSKALFGNTTGSYNTGVGFLSLRLHATGFFNTAIGDEALSNNKSCSYSTAVGGYALLYDTTNLGYNTAVGALAMLSNRSGNFNSVLGAEALYNDVSGDRNTAVGGNALYSDSTGSDNTGTGTAALFSNKNGSYNSAFGGYSLYSNQAANSNTSAGYYSLFSDSIGSYNTASGAYALNNNKTGSNNSAVGYLSSFNLSSGSFNTTLGSNADVSPGTITNATAIGANAIVTASNTIQLGNSSITNVNTYGNVSVLNGKGLIRSNDGTQQKKVTTIVAVSSSIGALSTINVPFSFNESFSVAPDVYVGNITGGAGGFAEVILSVADVSATGAILFISNPRSSTWSPSFTVKIIAIGPQ